MRPVNAAAPNEITQLLVDWSNGRQEALAELLPVVYGELRRAARRSLRRERPNHTLSGTALVNEVYLQLVDQTAVRWQNRAHFFGIAAKLMRQILVQHARRHQTAKRGGGQYLLALDEAAVVPTERPVDLVALDEALSNLAERDARKSRIVELRFFGGLSTEETAEVLGISPRTVKREWRLAKAWLYHELTAEKAMIQNDDWQRVDDLLQSALDCEPSQRASFLDEACAGDHALRQHVEALLAADHEASDFLERPAIEAGTLLAIEAASGSLVGRRIGAYRILRELGRGGMGEVYLAERADEQFRKQVAIKLVKHGMDSNAILHRFRSERQILASLDHPHIATLLDAGTTDDGLSYFIMEYVEGQPIDVYCTTHGLSTRERLHLFGLVCAAVQHAHEHQVVHRDLKPSNILVTEAGVPKLLDFGIAKLLTPDNARAMANATTVGLRPMTPAYASPEQVRGEPVTPVSDVYALGVLLYELLTGRPPYRVEGETPAEIARAICEQEPEKPSTAVGRGAPAARPRTPSRLDRRSRQYRADGAEEGAIAAVRLRRAVRG